GDIPILGWLFKSRSTDIKKTNLYIFLTPRVIKNPAEAAGIFQEKKEHFDTIKGGSIKFYEKHAGDAESETKTISEPLIAEPK
ncbi:MAG: hypothetical protein HKO68_14780, partial [Desulfobacterales bacterium]|nr:hypothetical protein [Desulfobacterales bacterium]